MKGLPLNLDMARAWHEGRKTVVRRLMKPQPEPHHWDVIKSHRLHHAMMETSDGWQCKFWRTIATNKEVGGVLWAKPRYQPGEVVYIQEPYIRAEEPDEDGNYMIWYAADYINDPTFGAARSPITMPEKFSRSKARIVDVRAEQIREITEDEARAEGFIEDVKMEYGYMTGPIDYTGRFAEERFEEYWETLHPGSWDRNDFVWRYGLERVEANGRYCADCGAFIGPDEWHCPKCGGCL